MTSTRRGGHEAQVQIRTSHPEPKPDWPEQRPVATTDKHDADAPPPTPPPEPAAALQTANDAGTNPNTLTQALPTPTSHAIAPIPSQTSKTEGHQSAPADLPAMPPLPSDRIQAARLVDRLGHAEMHLGVRTASFGSVQVHTIVRDSQVGVTIGSERGDLKSYLTSEVAGLESNLRQHDLHFADVRFVGTNLSSGGNQYGEKDSRQQSSQQGHAYARPTTRFTVDPRSPMDNETTNQQITGLSIHV